MATTIGLTRGLCAAPSLLCARRTRAPPTSVARSAGPSPVGSRRVLPSLPSSTSTLPAPLLQSSRHICSRPLHNRVLARRSGFHSLRSSRLERSPCVSCCGLQDSNEAQTSSQVETEGWRIDDPTGPAPCHKVAEEATRSRPWWSQDGIKDAMSKLVQPVAAMAGLAAVTLPGGFDLAGPGSTLEAVAVLAAIITVHESGHFLAARLQNIHVIKFAIGFGPRLISFQRKEVEYSLRAIPLGGYVAFPDEDPNSPYDKDDPDLLKNRPILDRAIVISAGVIANMIFAAAVLFAQVNLSGVIEQEFKAGVLVPSLVEGYSAAKDAGIKAGDLILAVDSVDVPAGPTSVSVLADYIKEHPERRIVLSIERGGELLQLPVVPALAKDGGGRIGVSLYSNVTTTRHKAEGFGEALALTFSEINRLTGVVLNGLNQIVFNFQETADKVSGPVAILAAGAEVARNDQAGLYQFAALVNINLAVVNLLPLPALDGGYLALLAVEAVRGGKKLPREVENAVMGSGLLLLLTIGMLLVVRDTLNLEFVRQLLQ